ncbi:hypothetical protein FQ087_13130 [Sporosarcina sp. ANT_H38]|uniref:hypothetical protein n=1 Tax=Sporosarcina sp. ANT_H38 TaxID=2597358 RepID=UPI0011F3376F|nr:hypothetical protein [Sporosarcina sp. ANT_H38]KAA0955547.1 hypothetical protein FQ087_13130 [Sporosarcina sp. ANT_H38]
MNIKTVMAYIVLIGCIILLLGSYSLWKDKLSSFHNDAEASKPSNGAVSKSKGDGVTEKPDSPVTSEFDVERLLSLTANQDASVQNVFKSRLQAGKPLNFLIVGSDFMTSGNPGFSKRLTLSLKEAYGDFITITEKSFDGSSATFIENLDEEFSIDSSYDVVLFEPFTLTNNGVVRVEDQHEHVKVFQQKIQSFVGDSVLVLQPAQPLPRGIFYPQEVQALQTFAASMDIPYINHWTEWMDSESEMLPNLLDANSSPTSDGSEVWANAVSHYFVAK